MTGSPGCGRTHWVGRIAVVASQPRGAQLRRSTGREAFAELRADLSEGVFPHASGGMAPAAGAQFTIVAARA